MAPFWKGNSIGSDPKEKGKKKQRKSSWFGDPRCKKLGSKTKKWQIKAKPTWHQESSIGSFMQHNKVIGTDSRLCVNGSFAI